MKVADLSVAKQQMVEIAKALSFNSKVLIMDEPTAALTETEIDELFRLIRQLQATGVGVVYISHRLEELQRISDRITVMRDGRYIDTVRTADATIERIISMMVGRTIYESAPEIADDEESQPIVLEVRNLNRGKSIQDATSRCGAAKFWALPGSWGRGAQKSRAPSLGPMRWRVARSSSRARRYWLPLGGPQALWPGAGYGCGIQCSAGFAQGIPQRDWLCAIWQDAHHRHKVCGCAANQDAQPAADGTQSLRRQSAEGCHWQVAIGRHGHPDFR